MNYNNIDEYIATCETQRQPLLQKVREIIKKAAPNATEKISWQMPTFYQNGNLIHFALQKKHLGIYPGASGIQHFAGEFEKMKLKYSKGAVQLPLEKQIPFDLIEKIVKFRVEENTK